MVAIALHLSIHAYPYSKYFHTYIVIYTWPYIHTWPYLHTWPYIHAYIAIHTYMAIYTYMAIHTWSWSFELLCCLLCYTPARHGRSIHVTSNNWKSSNKPNYARSSWYAGKTRSQTTRSSPVHHFRASKPQSSSIAYVGFGILRACHLLASRKLFCMGSSQRANGPEVARSAVLKTN